MDHDRVTRPRKSATENGNARSARGLATPTYALRLVHPFLHVLRRHPGFPLEFIEPLEAMDPDDRLPAAALNELLRGAIAITGDEDLGLHAAAQIGKGDGGQGNRI
jgi:hypothetical protein